MNAIIFDLDGTLLDTLDDIAAAGNMALEKWGFPTHPVEAYRYFVGNGSRKLMTRALPAEHRDRDTVTRGLESFLEAYRGNWHQLTRPYDGIPELLDELTRKKVPMAVLSNKPHAFTLRCVGHFFKHWPLHPVMGQQEKTPPKPDPSEALNIARTLSLAPAEILLLGDSATDMQTATGAGMQPVGAGWGFRTPAELLQNGAQSVLRHPLAVLEYL